jgi:hypothetical protein
VAACPSAVAARPRAMAAEVPASPYTDPKARCPIGTGSALETDRQTTTPPTLSGAAMVSRATGEHQPSQFQLPYVLFEWGHVAQT